ncbi:MAG: oxygenase MpaB family protein [Actinomycetota bacterium]
MRLDVPRPEYQRRWPQRNEPDKSAPMEDLGLFGPGSMVWRIHSDPASLLGGLRGLLVQALHPVAMAAVSQHSNYRDDPWGRLMRTSEYLTITTFGDTRRAREAASRLRAIHRRISGVDPVTGRSYRADDPDLLLWVHNVEVHSMIAGYRAYGGSLSFADADCYVREMVGHAELVGLSAPDVPRSYSEVHDYVTGYEGLALTPAALEGMRYVLSPPMPLPLRPLWTIPAAAAVAILPDEVRALYGIPWFAPAGSLVRTSTAALLKALKSLWPPPPPVREALARAERLAS